MTPVSVVDATTALRDWLRGATSAGERIYAGGFPQSVTLPAASISRVGGGFDVPVDLGGYQISAIAKSDPAAAALRDEIATILLSTNLADLGAGLSLRGSTIAGRWSALDPDDPSIRRAVLSVQICTVHNNQEN